jgi:MFS family permease
VSIILRNQDSPPKKSRYFKGWNMVLSGLLISFYVDGVGFWGFSGFFKEIILEFDWDRAVAAIAPSLHRLQSGIFSPFSGFIVDRWGARKTLLLGLFIAGLGFVLLSRIQNLWQYYAVFILIAFGLSAGSFVVIAALLNNWFIRSRGFVFSLLMLGPGLSAVLGGLWIFIIPTFGWRNTLLLAGLGFWFFCIPIVLAVMKDNPSDLGLSADGVIVDENSTDKEETENTEVKTLPMKEILLSRSYIQYVGALSLCGASFSVVTFAAEILTSYGFSNNVTATIFIFGFALPSLPARLFAGWLSDRIDKRFIFAVSISLQMMGTILFAIASVPFVAILAAALIGMGIGSTSPVRMALQSEYWGKNVFGRLSGIQMGVSAVPAIISPFFLGWIYDSYGTYREGLILLAVPLAFAAILALTIKRPNGLSK